jgi:hypothetical protein
MSLRNSFTLFRDITFSFNMYSALGFYRSFNRVQHQDPVINQVNMPKSEFWSPTNPTNTAARISSSMPTGFSVWRRADFVRLENVTVSYQVPRSFLTNLSIEALNVNVAIRNPGYLTRWPGQDPERDGNVPTHVNVGLNLTF